MRLTRLNVIKLCLDYNDYVIDPSRFNAHKLYLSQLDTRVAVIPCHKLYRAAKGVDRI